MSHDCCVALCAPSSRGIWRVLDGITPHKMSTTSEAVGMSAEIEGGRKHTSIAREETGNYLHFSPRVRLPRLDLLSVGNPRTTFVCEVSTCTWPKAMGVGWHHFGCDEQLTKLKLLVAACVDLPADTIPILPRASLLLTKRETAPYHY